MTYNSNPLEANKLFSCGQSIQFYKTNESLKTDSKRKWGLESESKPEIEEKHLLHEAMSN